MIFHGRQWSYRELNDRVNALALGLTKLGLKPGDRVVLWMKNCPQFIETMFATICGARPRARLTPGAGR